MNATRGEFQHFERANRLGNILGTDDQSTFAIRGHGQVVHFLVTSLVRRANGLARLEVIGLNAISGLLAAAGHLGAARDLDDATLLARFATERDPVAFEVLVWRHGGLVRGVCRRYLRDGNDIDDVTQSAFLALARKARSVRSVGPWLARVAAHAARHLRRANAARAARHAAVPSDVWAYEPSHEDGWRIDLTSLP